MLKTNFFRVYFLNCLNEGDDGGLNDAELSSRENSNVIIGNDPLIYPNPSEAVFYIQNVIGYELVETFDNMGRLIMKDKVDGSTLTIKLNDQPSAIYRLRLSSINGQNFEQDIIKN